MKNFYSILEQIAARHGTTAEEVYREMQASIEQALAEQDPAVQAAWREVPCPHGRPRPEDVIAYCLRKTGA